MASTALPAADFPAIDYDLVIHDGEVTTISRPRAHSVRLAGDRIEWLFNGYPQNAVLSDIRRIRLTTELETSQGPLACQISFRHGQPITVFGADPQMSDAAARQARYEAFVADLHRRLGPDDRSRIRFIWGFRGSRFGRLLVGLIMCVSFFVLAPPLTLLVGLSLGAVTPRNLLRVVSAMALGTGLSTSLFRLLQRNTPRIYDPDDPFGGATAERVGQTLGHAIDEIRRGVTRGK